MRIKNNFRFLSVCLLTVFFISSGFAETETSGQRTYTSKWTPKKNIAHIYMGGLLSFIKAGYEYEYTDTIYGEEMRLIDEVSNSETLGFSAGAGFFVIEFLEIGVGLNTFSKSLSGLYGFSLPNIYLWDDIASDEATASPVFKEMAFHFGVNIHPLNSGSVRPFLGAGLSYVSGKMELLNDILYKDTYYVDLTHEIEITEVELVKTNLNKLGFNFCGGMDIYITNRLAFYASGRFVMAKKEIDHPLTSQFEEGEILELDLGGLSANLGIKVFF